MSQGFLFTADEINTPAPKIKRCARYEVRLVRSESMPYHAREIRGSDDAIKVCVQILQGVLSDATAEKFVIVTLDTKHRPIGFHLVTQGTLDASLVHPREVFQHAILANASAIILSHNHPSGDLTPSPEDRAVTARLQKCGELLGIRVLDHIIVGNHPTSGEFFGRSLAAESWM